MLGGCGGCAGVSLFLVGLGRGGGKATYGMGGSSSGLLASLRAWASRRRVSSSLSLGMTLRLWRMLSNSFCGGG